MKTYSFQFSSKEGEPALLTWVHVAAPDEQTAYALACKKFVEKRYVVTRTQKVGGAR